MALPTGPVDARGESRVASDDTLRLQILGPLRIWRDGAEVDPGPRQQAALLGLLLARESRPISTAELIDLIWDENAPASAMNVLHKYVGMLRRLLEPGLQPRESGSYLLRRNNGYLFTAGLARLDLALFRRYTAAGAAAVTEHRRDAALDDYAQALDLWTGAAGDGLVQTRAATAVFASLNEDFFDACVAASELAIELGRPERVLTALRLAAEIGPLHEPVQAGLIATLGAAGRQGEALAVYQEVRTRLVEDLGIDPGPTLEAAQRAVLTQASAPVAAQSNSEQPTRLVGHAEELAVLRQMVDVAGEGGSCLAIVEGQPGSGKTTVLQEAAADADSRGLFVVWGNSLEGEGTPSMWPWVQAVGAVLATLPPAAQEKWLASDVGRLIRPHEGILAGSFLPDSGTQFRLFEGVVGVLAEAAAQRPILLVLDDLHWADDTSLQMLTHLAARLPSATVVFGALRDRAPAPGTALARTLAATSRVAGHRRIRVRPLSVAEAAEVVRRETGSVPDEALTRSVYARTSGNPFFVRELARFLADNGALDSTAAVSAGVPATVRDLVRDRLARLDDATRDLLMAASLVGRIVRVDVLAEAAGIDLPTCLDRLEALVSSGTVEPTPGDPYTFRFAHDLVRESVVGIIPPRRAGQLHMQIADALERVSSAEEAVAEQLAYHLWSAGPLADPKRTAAALVRAGSCAATKSALEAAERHLRSAVEISHNARLPELELAALSQLTAVVGMRSMYGAASVDLMTRAEVLARELGHELEATGFLYSRWAAHAQGIELDRSGPLARRLLEQGYASADPIVKAYGLQAWGIHQWDIGNIGEAFRYLSQSERTLLANLARHDEDPVRRDLKLLMTGMLAEVTALHGDIEGARGLLDTLEATAGDSPYRITVWASMTARIASIVGDPDWALPVVGRGIAVDPSFSFVFLGTYQRLARCWALVMVGKGTDATISEAQKLIAANLLDPPRSCVATWYGLLGEMHLAVGATEAAAGALDRADFYLNAYGQRNPEGLLLLLRARLLHARGEPTGVVRRAAERARALSLEREARLYADRAELFLSELD
ncbi:Transcriptional regulatory protein, C terminal [Mycolicibacterium rutilum]|uniref:Transcriptional regulatory protein, C terminal n=1 Tax=Mycolicibacterium rutilum TaxID=370526 RepID=A0A1H6IUV6_MYCRU|nr:Transcriptional regulatory protein, C terminal [Mycolicibacterium rutilum]